MLFEKPKYAFVYEKGGSHCHTEQIWGVGKVDTYDCLRSYRRKHPMADYGDDETSSWFLFLYIENGVLLPMDDEEAFILLTEPPTEEMIKEMIKYIDDGNDADCFTTDKMCMEVAHNDKQNKPSLQGENKG